MPKGTQDRSLLGLGCNEGLCVCVRSGEMMARQRTKAMAAALAEVLDGATMVVAANANGVTTRGLYKAMVQEGLPRRGRGRPITGRNPKPRDDLSRRKNRLQQAAHRGSRSSYKTDAENLGLLLLWEAAVLSEDQVAKALDIDRVTLRMMREGAMAEAMKMAEALVYETDLRRPSHNTPNVRAKRGQTAQGEA